MELKAKFVEIVEGIPDVGDLHHEIVNVNTIQNIYIVNGEEGTSIVIRCVYAKKFNGDSSGRWLCRDFTEYFADKHDCQIRYRQLLELLTEPASYEEKNLIREASSDFAKVKKELQENERRYLDKCQYRDFSEDTAINGFVNRNYYSMEYVKGILGQIKEKDGRL